MRARGLLVALIVLATAGFVVGTAIERNGGEAAHHEAAAGPSAREAGESEAARSEGDERSGRAQAAALPGHAESGEAGRELRPLGVDIEAWPFVALAAIASLGLALAAWLRPRDAALLGVVAVAMLVFAALDVREILHQLDEDRTGLALLAAGVALLHFCAGALAAALVVRARGRRAPPGRAATMRA